MTATSFIQKGVDAATQGNLTEAENCFRQAFLLSKKEHAKFNIGAANLIRLLHQQKKDIEIVEVIKELGEEQALALPQICILMAAESALKTGQNRESAALYRALHSKHPHEKQVVLGYSQALLMLGELRQAKDVLKNYIPQNGIDAEAISNLALIALEEGDIKDAEIHYRMAANLAPETFVTHYNLGKFLQMHGDLNAALAEFDKCVEIIPNAIEAKIAKAETLKGQGETERSRELYIKTLKNHKVNKEQTIAIVRPLLAEALERDDIESCGEYLSMASDEIRSDFRVRSIMHDLTKELQAQFGNGENLYDPRELVKSTYLFRDRNYLNIIKDQVLSNKSLIENRPGKPTRSGRQTHEIMETSNKELATLKEQLKEKLIEYAMNLPDSIKPSSNSVFKISGWAVSLASGGYQVRHSHPEAIASGVFYVSIPPDMNQEGSKNPGALYFSSRQGNNEQKELYIKPENGMLVLFPSYMPHETTPFESMQERICIAVNLIQIK